MLERTRTVKARSPHSGVQNQIANWAPFMCPAGFTFILGFTSYGVRVRYYRLQIHSYVARCGLNYKDRGRPRTQLPGRPGRHTRHGHNSQHGRHVTASPARHRRTVRNINTIARPRCAAPSHPDVITSTSLKPEAPTQASWSPQSRRPALARPHLLVTDQMTSLNRHVHTSPLPRLNPRQRRPTRPRCRGSRRIRVGGP